MRSWQAVFAAATYFVWFLIANGIVGENWNWTALEAVGTTAAVAVALYYSRSAKRETRERNEIRSAAVSGELAMELLETGDQIAKLLAASTALATSRISPQVVDERVAQAIREIRFTALEKASEHADVLDLDTARWVGSLLGQLRLMQAEERRFSALVEKPMLGYWAFKMTKMAVDTIGKISTIYKYVWVRSGLVGDPNAAEERFEKFRLDAIAFLQKQRQAWAAAREKYGGH